MVRFSKNLYSSCCKYAVLLAEAQAKCLIANVWYFWNQNNSVKIKQFLIWIWRGTSSKTGQLYRIPAPVGFSSECTNKREVSSGHSVLAEVTVSVILDVKRAKTSLIGVITGRCVQTAKCEGYRAGSLI